MGDDLAQFFTPGRVVEFALDALCVLGLRGGRLRIADPACGAGAFLAAAARRFPEAEIWGCDVDGRLEAGWQASGLGGGKAHLLVQDGLVDAPLLGMGAGTFDLVIGNPPYGFGVRRAAGSERIESQFLRRFVGLARPGGWIGVVLPEGIAANALSQELRDWVLARAAVRAIIGLPEATFARTGTRARTVLMLAQKGASSGASVLLASPAATEPLGTYLDAVRNEIRGRA